MMQVKGTLACFHSRLMCAAALTALTIASSPGTAQADFVLASNMLPPQGNYLSTTNVAFGAVAALDNLSFGNFASQVVPPPLGGNINSISNCAVTLDLSIGGGSFSPMAAAGNATIKWTHDSDIGSTMHFNTEMLALNIGGGNLPAGTMLRESPTLASTGVTTMTPIGGGLYQISSFFDIFTEISLDGGQTWSPGSVAVQSVEPAPGALSMLGLAFLGCRSRRRR